MTEGGMGNGENKRLLEGSKVLLTATPFMAEGKKIQTGNPSKDTFSGLNPITIDENGKWVYFGPMSERNIFRIRSKDLRDFTLSDVKLEAKVEKYGYKPHSDGIKIDKDDVIYIGDLNKLEIGTLKRKKYETYIKSEILTWVDGFFVHDDYVYATVNQLNRHPNFNGGVDGVQKPYMIIKFKRK